MSDTPTKEVRPVKLRAVQPVFYRNTMVQEGEVYAFFEQELPPKEVAVRVPASVPLGSIYNPDDELKPDVAPAWSTKGYVDGEIANRGTVGDEDLFG